MNVEELLLIIIGALVAGAVGTIFAYQTEFIRERKTVKKIKELLNEEFFDIYEAYVDEQDTIQKAKASIKTDISKIIDNTTTISDYFYKHGQIFQFSIWTAISTSGDLIKLSKDEIVEIEAMHNAVLWFNSEQKNNLDDHFKQFDEELGQKDFDDIDDEELTEILESYLDMTLKLLKDVFDAFNELKTIPWIKLPK